MRRSATPKARRTGPGGADLQADTHGDKCLSLDDFKAGQKPPIQLGKKAAGKKFQRKQVESAVKE